MDDLILLGTQDDVNKMQLDLKSTFQCKLEGSLTEYVGRKIDVTCKENGIARIKFTQSVLLQKLKNKFMVPVIGKVPTTLAVAGQVLVKGDGSGTINRKEVTKYQSGTTTCMFVMQWSHPEIYNATRNLARNMQASQPAHVMTLNTLIWYLTSTPNCGLELEPDLVRDGGKDCKFKIHECLDSDYAANTNHRGSVSGGRVFSNGSPIMFRSAMHKFVTFLVTKAKSAAGVMVTQDMMHAYHILMSLGLKVETPMILEMDIKGAVDLVNNWSVGGRTRHVDVRNHFLHELKDQGLSLVKHISGDSDDADISTKDVTAAIFNKHILLYIGQDEYMSASSEPSSREGVRVSFAYDIV